MAIDRGTTVRFTADRSRVLVLRSSVESDQASVTLGEASGMSLPAEEPVGRPPWGRLAAALVAEVSPSVGGSASINTNLPVGAGLSSSAAFCVSLAMALGADEATPAEMAGLCQRAESTVGSDVGLMDPLVVTAASEGHALLIDFATLALRGVPVPEEASVAVVHSGVPRTLGATPYAARRGECADAARILGVPLGAATTADTDALRDPVLRRRALHVVTESARVVAFAEALAATDLGEAGLLMTESHQSLAHDFAASLPVLDELVDTLTRTPGVHGARMTGGGFGGCVVALADHGALDLSRWPGRAWHVVPSAGATLERVGRGCQAPAP